MISDFCLGFSVERDLEGVAAAKALAAAPEEAAEPAQPDWEISGAGAGVAAASTLPAADAGSYSLPLSFVPPLSSLVSLPFSSSFLTTFAHSLCPKQLVRNSTRLGSQRYYRLVRRTRCSRRRTRRRFGWMVILVLVIDEKSQNHLNQVSFVQSSRVCSASLTFPRRRSRREEMCEIEDLTT